MIHFTIVALQSPKDPTVLHRALTGYGTLYRALGRLEQMRFVESGWEDPHDAADENRPRRRLYTLTAAGETALSEQAPKRRAVPKRVRRRLAPA